MFSATSVESREGKGGTMTDELAMALGELEEDRTVQIVQERLARGDDPAAIMKSCQDGMIDVGKRFERGEYFISDLMLSGEIFKRATALLPDLAKTGAITKGKIVFGTVKGDIHNIGKDIVVGLLKAAGYEVIDLGIDVPAGSFVDAVRDTGASIVGLSGLLTVAFDSMKETIAAFSAAGLNAKVMIGGGTISATVQQYTGADAWGNDAQSAISIANEWTREAAK
jgi:5-methyltetrahydrofolate--homocysteine methyltransferase